MSKLQVEISVLDKISAQVVGINKTLTNFANNVEKSFGMMTKGFIAIAALGGVAAGLKRITDAAINYGDSVSDMAKRTGLSIEKVQEIGYVAKVSGTNIDNLQKAFKQLSVKAYENDTAFKVLGINIRDNNGNLRETGAIFQDTILKLADVKNSTERAALSNKVFGKASIDVNGIIAEGSGKIRELIKETEDYGLILDEKVAQRLDKVKDLQERWNTQLSVTGAKLVSSLSPAISVSIEILTHFANKFSKFAESIFGPEQMTQMEMRIANLKQLIQLNETSLKEWSVPNDATSEQKLAAERERLKIVADTVKLKKELADLENPNKTTTTTNDDFSNKKTNKSFADKYAGLLPSQEQIDYFIEEQKKTTDAIVDEMNRRNEALADAHRKTLELQLEGYEKQRQADADFIQSRENQIEKYADLGISIGNAFAEGIGSGKDAVKSVFKSMLDTFLSFIEKQITLSILANSIKKFGMTGPVGLIQAAAEAALVSGLFGVAKAAIGSFASGGTASYSGFYDVGEQGRERVYLPAGSQVMRASQIMNTTNNTQSSSMTFVFQSNDGREIDRLRSDVRSGRADRLISEFLSRANVRAAIA